LQDQTHFPGLSRSWKEILKTQFQDLTGGAGTVNVNRGSQLERDVLEVFAEEPAAVEYDGTGGAATVTGAGNRRRLDVGQVPQLLAAARQRPRDAGRRQRQRIAAAALRWLDAA